MEPETNPNDLSEEAMRNLVGVFSILFNTHKRLIQEGYTLVGDTLYKPGEAPAENTEES